MFDKGGGRGTASMGEKFLPAREVGSEKQKDGLSEARWRRKMGWEVVSKDAERSMRRKRLMLPESAVQMRSFIIFNQSWSWKQPF